MFFLTDPFLNNYTGENNLYSVAKYRDLMKELLRKDFRAPTEWVFENYIVLNQNKYHYMCIGRNNENGKFEFDNVFRK